MGKSGVIFRTFFVQEVNFDWMGRRRLASEVGSRNVEATGPSALMSIRNSSSAHTLVTMAGSHTASEALLYHTNTPRSYPAPRLGVDGAAAAAGAA